MQSQQKDIASLLYGDTPDAKKRAQITLSIAVALAQRLEKETGNKEYADVLQTIREWQQAI